MLSPPYGMGGLPRGREGMIKTIDSWQSCYDNGWQGNIVPEAFSHPAKVSFGLAGKIYNHAINMGWVKRGDYCLDPFGGICGFGFHAMCYGLNWIGVELEEKFVSLGQQNIELWNRQLRGWPNLGTARIVQGDSRKIVAEIWFQGFKDAIEKVDLVVSSPNFPTDQPCQSQTMAKKDYHAFTRGDGTKRDHEMRSPGNLTNMNEGQFDAVIGSPPYAGSMESDKGGIDWEKAGRVDRTKPSDKRHSVMSNNDPTRYGHTPGQLSQLREGSFDMCVSSPPYEESLKGAGIGIDFSKTKRDGDVTKQTPNSCQGRIVQGFSKENLSQNGGDTFWSASKEIVSQCYSLLKPGGHAIWVTKNYVKAKKIVPFTDRWIALCESIGFKVVCHHHAMLVKSYGTQQTINGEDEEISIERKSFFRRLAESKGSPRIDYESVVCMVKL